MINNRMVLAPTGSWFRTTETVYYPPAGGTKSGSLSGGLIGDYTRELSLQFVARNVGITFEATMEDRREDALSGSTFVGDYEQWIDVTKSVLSLASGAAGIAVFAGSGSYADIVDFGSVPFHKFRVKCTPTVSGTLRLVAQSRGGRGA